MEAASVLYDPEGNSGPEAVVRERMLPMVHKRGVPALWIEAGSTLFLVTHATLLFSYTYTDVPFPGFGLTIAMQTPVFQV